jgi:3-oxoacyl-[acyl-carrier protein] reductase
VNAVSAGPIDAEPFLEGHPPEVIELTARTNPLHRLGAPNPIAAAVSFLVGTAGACINGQVLRTNGGRT